MTALDGQFPQDEVIFVVIVNEGGIIQTGTGSFTLINSASHAESVSYGVCRYRLPMVLPIVFTYVVRVIKHRLGDKFLGTRYLFGIIASLTTSSFATTHHPHRLAR